MACSTSCRDIVLRNGCPAPNCPAYTLFQIRCAGQATGMTWQLHGEENRCAACLRLRSVSMDAKHPPDHQLYSLEMSCSVSSAQSMKAHALSLPPPPLPNLKAAHVLHVKSGRPPTEPPTHVDSLTDPCTGPKPGCKDDSSTARILCCAACLCMPPHQGQSLKPTLKRLRRRCTG